MDSFRKEYKATYGTITKLIERVIIENGWTTLFLLLCLLAYESGSLRYNRQHARLEEKLASLMTEKEEESHKNHILKWQRRSLTDPHWIELVLIEELGVAPKGQKKIYFEP